MRLLYLYTFSRTLTSLYVHPLIYASVPSMSFHPYAHPMPSFVIMLFFVLSQ